MLRREKARVRRHREKLYKPQLGPFFFPLIAAFPNFKHLFPERHHFTVIGKMQNEAFFPFLKMVGICCARLGAPTSVGLLSVVFLSGLTVQCVRHTVKVATRTVVYKLLSPLSLPIFIQYSIFFLMFSLHYCQNVA